MIVVRIEMWPKGSEKEKRDIAIVAIANVGGDASHGNYVYGISHQAGTDRAKTLDPHLLVQGKYTWKKGSVFGFKRHLGAVRLVLRVLDHASLLHGGTE